MHPYVHAPALAGVVSAWVPAQVPPARAAPHERHRLRAAAAWAPQVYPGPVGELISRELTAAQEMSWATHGSSLVTRLVDEVLRTPLPRGGGR